MKTNNILFIRGFNTDNIETGDEYINIYTVLKQNNSITYFNYSPNDDILKTYKKLCKVIKDNHFTDLIGHSMGGGLLLKYISDYPNEIPKYKNVVLLMPLLYKVPLTNFLANMPLVRKLRVPKAFILPASKISSLGNFLNDEYNLLSLTQIVDMYKHLMLDSDVFVKVLNKHRKNTVLFYAREEAFNNIPLDIRNKIKNKEYVNGLHECFNSLETTNYFFNKFLRYIN